MNKAIAILLAAIAVFGATVSVGLAQADGQPKDNVKVFMRAKLMHAQKILEGLTIEDFDMIAKHSQQLRLLSQATQWQVLQTPEYTRRSNEFRRATDEMGDAAKKKNLDGATLKYVNVTIKCVECHKYVRSVRNAKLDLRGLPGLEPARTAAK